MPWTPNEAGETMWFPYTTFAFIIGCITSMLCGLIGMKVATKCNVKVTYLCAVEDINAGFDAAFRGG
jgi:Na+/H+-translocating membrane pyrophosphatase